MFHRHKGPVTVLSREEEDGLGHEWSRIIWPVSAMPEPEAAPARDPEPQTEGYPKAEPEPENLPAAPHRPARIPIRPPDHPAKPAKKKRT